MMPVFAVLAHAQPVLVARLVDALAPHPVVLHVDAKVDIDPFRNLPRTEYVEDRVDVNWGGLSVALATIKLFEKAVQMAAPDEHIILLTGQCYPTRSMTELTQFLAQCPWRQHCDGAIVFDGTRFSEQRLSKRWLFDRMPVRRGALLQKPIGAARRLVAAILPRRSARDFSPVVPVAGSQMIALTAACVSDILPNAKDSAYLELFRDTLAPDEMFFHTLVHNSDRWKTQTRLPPATQRLGVNHSDFASLHFISYHPTLSHLDAMRSPGTFFVRKVEWPESRELIETLDRLRDQSP